MASNLLTSYEGSFKIQLILAKLELAKAPSQPLSQRNEELKRVEQRQDRLFDLLDQMDVEVNNSIGDASERATYKAKLREWKKTIQSDIKRPLQSLVDSGDGSGLE
uniref:DBL2_02 binder n=1 Tax=chemical production metagenome TaxID=2495586 RepID=UPI00241813F3